MARRSNHYEQALEQTLLAAGALMLPIDEARTATHGGRELKNFDYVIYREPTANAAYPACRASRHANPFEPPRKHLLVEVKGRRVSGPMASNAWATKQDAATLTAWQCVFGADFEPAFAFVHELPGPGGTHFEWGGRHYQGWLVRLNAFLAFAHERSASWGTLCMSARSFRASATPLLDEVLPARVVA